MVEKSSSQFQEFQSRYGWVIVALVFVSAALVLGSRFSMGLFLPFLPEALNTSATSVSAAIALSMLGAAAVLDMVFIILVGYRGDDTAIRPSLGPAAPQPSYGDRVADVNSSAIVAGKGRPGAASAHGGVRVAADAVGRVGCGGGFAGV